VEWKDMEAVKVPSSKEKALFFCRKRYLRYVKTLLNEIMVHQNTSAFPLKEPELFEDTAFQSASLTCEHNQLFIKLMGGNGVYIDNILIHKFNNDSSPQIFFEGLINKGVGAVFYCEKGGGTVAKHILEVKFPKYLQICSFTKSLNIELR
jgi:hypothetical protein